MRSGLKLCPSFHSASVQVGLVTSSLPSWSQDGCRMKTEKGTVLCGASPVAASRKRTWKVVARAAKPPDMRGTVPHDEDLSHQLCHVEKRKELEKESCIQSGEQGTQRLEARTGPSRGLRAGGRV